MRNHGTEEPIAAEASGIGGSGAGGVGSSEPKASDIVFDFSALDAMRFQDLSFLLTARQLVSEDDGTVWATGVPVETWRTLYAMGLSGLFRPFPTSDVEDA
ncbi:MAG: hypothetical protein R3223_00950 [Longimicrobiales bacterium]|nr:hypothetical protein [Longimicrobiales bacterium]